MATTTANVAPNNATAVEFRAWAQFIHDVFANGSWVQTADTGQINLTTVAAPGAANTKQGYEIWRTDDSLQSTNPLFLKLAYGSGSSTNVPAIWFMVGTGTDGAGNMIDTTDGNRPAFLLDFYSQSVAPISSRSNSATTRQCFGSATTSRAVFYMFEGKPALNGTGNPCNWAISTQDDAGVEASFSNLFSIERARDASGALIGTHFVAMWTGTTASQLVNVVYGNTSDRHVVLAPTTGTVALRPTTNINAHAYMHDSLLGSNIVAQAIIPFERNTKPAWPGINVVISRSSIFEFDLGAPGIGGNCGAGTAAPYVTGRTASVSPYGVARTYRTCAGTRGSTFRDGNIDTGAFIWILYE